MGCVCTRTCVRREESEVCVCVVCQRELQDAESAQTTSTIMKHLPTNIELFSPNYPYMEARLVQDSD